MPKTLYIIDGHSLIYAAYYAPMRQNLTSPAGEPTKAAYIFTTALLGLIRNRKPDMLTVAMDSKTPSFRTKIYSDYKAHRPPMPDDLPGQIDRIEQILDAMNVPVLRIDGFEADDIIGTLAGRASAAAIQTFICSKDKDMLQLLDDNTLIYDIKTGKTTDRRTLMDEMKITPQQFIDCLALQGDAVDNVPGVPDVGPKTAVEWICKYGSLENLYRHADEIEGKRGRNLRESEQLVRLSRSLVVIDRSVPLAIDYEALTTGPFDTDKLTAIFAELGFSRLMTQLGLTAQDSAEISLPRPAADAQTVTGPASAATVRHNYQLVDTEEKFAGFLEQLKGRQVFAVDTETDSIRPMRAGLVGISFSWQPHSAYYLPVRSPIGTKHLDAAVVRSGLAPILADENVKKIGQNIKYDLLVLRNAKMPVKGVFFDTMVASYCLDAERTSHSMDQMALDYLNYECIPISSLIGKGRNALTLDMVDTAAACEYSAEDADITLQLYNYLSRRLDKEPPLKKLFYDVEMPIVAVLAEMEYNGVCLDVKLLREMSVDIADELKTVSQKIYDYAGSVFNIDSPRQLAEILFDRLGLESPRITKAGRSTDAAVLDYLTGQHPIIEPILQYRSLSKLQNTYVDKLGSLINPRTGRVHASFNQTITVTGRLSSSDPNLQNIPVRTELGRKIRSAFIPAHKTDCILSADYSQIELRLLAHFSGDKALRQAFAADMDIHRFVASQIYGIPIDQVTNQMRSSCKAVNFGIIYGQGPYGLSQTTGMSMDDAKKFIDAYFARYSAIRDFMDSAVAQAKKVGFAETILHRRRQISNLASSNASRRAQAGRFVVNTIIQGSAADLIKVAMINIIRRIHADLLPVKLILQIHDELVFELPTAEAKRHADWITREMTGAIELHVPLKVDISFGPSWLTDK